MRGTAHGRTERFVGGPPDCVEGTPRLHGSTAFAPAVRAAAEDRLGRCEGVDGAISLEDDTFVVSKGAGVENLRLDQPFASSTATATAIANR